MPLFFFFIAAVIVVFGIVIYKARSGKATNMKVIYAIGLICLIISFILFRDIGSGLLNLGSLVLGLIAWILPVYNLAQRNKANYKNWVILSVASVSACAISLCMQIFYNNHLVKLEEWSALMDTSDALALVSSILLVITIVLNSITLAVYLKKLKTDKF